MVGRRVIALWVLSVFLLAGCSTFAGEGAEGPGELVIYSGRAEQFVLPLTELFEEETGIRVRLLSGNATQYAHRIIEEKDNPRADIFFANDAGIMEYLRLHGVLASQDIEGVKAIPETFRADDNSWIGLSARSRVLMYNTDLISEEDMPQSILDLVDPRYQGRFAVTRPGNASMVSHIAALRAVLGDEKTEEFLRGLLENQPVIMGGHTDIRRAVGQGEVEFGLVNNYYFHLQLEEETGNQVGAIYPDQGEDQMGTFVNVAGVALVKGGPNEENARKFLQFLLEPAQQEIFAFNSKETPLVPDVPTLDYAKGIDQYNHLKIPLRELGPLWEDTLDLMEGAGFVD